VTRSQQYQRLRVFGKDRSSTWRLVTERPETKGPILMTISRHCSSKASGTSYTKTGRRT